MRKLLLILLIPMIGFGQYPKSWESREVGNAFDGFNRTAFIFNDEGYMLAVKNSSDKILLDCGESFSSDNENNYLQNNSYIIISNSFAPSTVLISFDDDDEYYKTVFYDRGKNDADKENMQYTVSISELISSDYSKMYLKDFFLNKLKQHSKINFRFLNNNQKKDISFSLKSSTDAINDIVKYSKCSDDNVGIVRHVMTMGIVFDRSKFKDKTYYFDIIDISNAITSNLGYHHPYTYAYRYYKYSDAPRHIISFFNENDKKVGEFKYLFPQKYDNRENALKFGFKLFNNGTKEDYKYEEYVEKLKNNENLVFWLYEQFVKQGYDKKKDEFIKLMNISYHQVPPRIDIKTIK